MLTVTLLSDFGEGDAANGIIKVQLAQHVANVCVVDVTHQVAMADLREASYYTLKSYRFFPAGSVHILATAIFNGDRNRMLLAEIDGHFFIAADNGLLSLTFPGEVTKVWLAREFSGMITTLEWFDSAISIIRLLQQGANIDEHLLPFTIASISQPTTPQPLRDRIDCNIIHLDRYGNIVLNITRAEFDEKAKSRGFSVVLPGGKKLTEISLHYYDVPEGSLLCRFNSLDRLEIAVNHGSAASLFQFDAALSKNINYKLITIHF